MRWWVLACGCILSARPSKEFFLRNKVGSRRAAGGTTTKTHVLGKKPIGLWPQNLCRNFYGLPERIQTTRVARAPHVCGDRNLFNHQERRRRKANQHQSKQ